MIALDCETTGKDLYHGAKPFFVTMCDEEGNQQYWEWDVDPLTREPIISGEDIEEICAELESADSYVMHNGKFDVTALKTIQISWDNAWDRTHDTIIAAHLLASNHPKNLTALAIEYLGEDIEPYEKALEKACQEARRWARSKRPDWLIAHESLPCMPSCKGGNDEDKTERKWGYDMWLPRAVVKELDYEPDHPWWTVLRDYSNKDSETTIHLWYVMQEEIKRRGYWPQYEAAIKQSKILYKMEAHGLTLNGKRLADQHKQYSSESYDAGQLCVAIAADYGYELDLPKGASPNDSLRTFIFDVMGLEKRYDKKGKSGNPTLNKQAMQHYKQTLPKRSMEYEFINTLLGKRSRDTALAYMEGYKRFWLPTDWPDYFRIHPWLNIVGTDATRFSSKNPNEQNISKKELFNLRRCFGPAPGREWYSLDGKNLELRIPAYECGEQAMLELFERPNDPPYYGSYHLLNFSIVFKDVWDMELKEVGFEKVGPHCKSKYESTHYQDTKNGGFCKQYGGQRALTDATFKREGAYDLLNANLPNMARLNKECIDHANRYGYVETIPDTSIDPEHGYPLICTRSDYGQVLPTVPLSYHIQGTAGMWMRGAMVRVDDFFERLNSGKTFAGKKWPGGYHIIMNVHDELVLDCPKGKEANRPVIEEVKRLMEIGGDYIGVKTPVDVEYHSESWDKGEKW